MARFHSAKGRLSLLVTFCIINAAVPAVSAPIYNLAQTLALAEHNNGELKSLREETGAYDAAVAKAALWANPVLEFSGATGANTGSPSENSLSIGVSQELVTAGKTGKKVQTADRERERFLWQLRDRERLVRDQVTGLFYQYLLSRQRVALAERSIALSRQLLEVTNERLAAGDIPELDANLARVEVARAAEKKALAERDLVPARRLLGYLAGLPAAAQAEFADTLDVPWSKAALSDLQQVALHERPDLKALAAEIAWGEAEVALAMAERYPNVTAGLTLTRERTTVDVGTTEGTSLDYLVGVRLSMPLPVFDRNEAGIRQARAKKDGAVSRFLFAQAAVETEVEVAYARLTACEQSLSHYRQEILPQLEENLKLVQEGYRLGEVGILAVIEEQKKFVEVTDGYQTALHERAAAVGKLETAVGRLGDAREVAVHE